MKYQAVKDGEWVEPIMNGYKIACCDCSLVHRIDLKVIKSGRGHAVQYRAFRDNRSTAAMRRKSKTHDK